MAHNLEIVNGEASMFYVDRPPWHGLGRRLAEPATAEEAIQGAKLDWEVAKVPLYAAGNARMFPVDGKFGIVRKDKWDSDDCKVLGVVSQQYTPLQNREAFTFFDPIVGDGAAICYHTAGVLGDGQRIWILAKLPDSITVRNGDISDKFLLLTNSHDGESAVQMKFTPIRVVCQNTLMMALGEGRTIRITHEERAAAAQGSAGPARDHPQRVRRDREGLQHDGGDWDGQGPARRLPRHGFPRSRRSEGLAWCRTRGEASFVGQALLRQRTFCFLLSFSSSSS